NNTIKNAASEAAGAIPVSSDIGGRQTTVSEPTTRESDQQTSAGTGIPERTGIAQRVEEARRQGEAPRGEGITAEASVERGRELLRNGRDPQAVVDEFKRSGAISSDTMAIVRARHEELAKTANQAFDAGGQNLNDPAFKKAEQARQDWWENSVKPLQTEWAKTGMAQQG